MTGSLSILNVGAGDIQVSFNEHDDTERVRAIRMLKDMQARGYAILIRLADGTYTRALEIDAAQGAYIIQLPESSEETADDAAGHLEAPRRRGRPRRTSVPIVSAHAVGVARSAGG